MRQVAFSVEASLEATAEARAALRSEFTDQLPATALYDLLTVVTELVKNGVEHGPGSPVRVLVRLDEAGTVRGEVEDDGSGPVAIAPIGETFDRGLGLRIVDTLSQTWGVRDGTSRVWFELKPV